MQQNRRPLPHPLLVRVSYNSEVYHEQVFHEFPITIGRNPNCDVPLSDFDFVSRQHAVISFEENRLRLIDLNSANQFMYQGRLERDLEIKDHVEIQIGEIFISIEPLRQEKKNTAPQVAPKENTLVVEDFTGEVSQVHIQEEPVLNDNRTELDISPPPSPQSAPLQASGQVAKTSDVKKRVEVNVDGKIKDSVQSIKAHQYAKDFTTKNRVLEAFVTWKDQIYDHQVFFPNTKISLGVSEDANLKLPTLRGDLSVAYYDGKTSSCLIPQGAQAVLSRGNKEIHLEEMIRAGILARRSKGYVLQLQNEDLLQVHYSPTSSLFLRYAPAPKRLTKTQMLKPEEEIKKSMTISGIIHFFLIAIAFFSPAPTDVPKIKNVPERYAKLLVKQPPKKIEKPKPTPTPKPTPKPTPPPKKEKPTPRPKPTPAPKPVPKKVVQKKPIKPIPIKPEPKLQQVNKFPVEVKKPEPKITDLGALGALTALKPNPNQQSVSVKINQDNSAPNQINTSGIVAGLKTNSGKLAASGNVNVGTKGLGFGSGKGFGTQGLEAGAGQAGVAGAVVGSPKLASSSKLEGLTREQVMATLQKHVSKIQRCYERSLFDNPNLKGRVEYQWEISPGGKVQWAKVLKTDMSGADALNDCVKNVFMAIQFPAAKNGQSTVPNIGFPFGRL